MPTSPQPGPPPRTRLEDAPDVYAIALAVADSLDDAELDLWASGVRACLDAPGTTARQQHLVVELTRLSHMTMVRSSAVADDIARALRRLEIGLGAVDLPVQPLYAAVRDLADHLELHGGGRWLARLRAVVADHERTAAARLQRLDAVLGRMVPGEPGLPEGTRGRVDAVVQRLPRHRDAEEVLRYVVFGLTRPQPSRRGARQGEARGAEPGR